MHALINPPHTVLTIAKADRLAQHCNDRDEDGWTYEAVPASNGADRAVVKVYDEGGEFLGNL